MQAQDQIKLFVIIVTPILFLLAALIISLLFAYQKRQLAYQQNLDSLKLDFEKSLLKTQVEVQEQTFQDISREIHDNISLSLTLVKLNLNTLDWNDTGKTCESVKSSIAIISAAIADLSNLSKSMNTELIKDLGLMKVAKNEIEKLKDLAGLQVGYEVKGEPVFMDSGKELIIFRIIQEAFNNVVKHSKASKVCLQLDYNHHSLTVMIKDNGTGFNKEEAFQKEMNKAGLSNMYTRTKLLGGNFSLESGQQKGTEILITVPYI